MKMSEVFERAAEIVDAGKRTRVCCWAIQMAEFPGRHYLHKDNPRIDFFSSLYEADAHPVFWWGYAQTQERVIALLLAAAIARSEGL